MGWCGGGGWGEGGEASHNICGGIGQVALPEAHGTPHGFPGFPALGCLLAVPQSVPAPFLGRKEKYIPSPVPGPLGDAYVCLCLYILRHDVYFNIWGYRPTTQPTLYQPYAVEFSLLFQCLVLKFL